MNRGIVAAIGGAAIMVAGLTGCSGNKSSSSETSASSESSSHSASASASAGSASAGAGSAKVTIDGKPKNVEGQVVCAAAGGNYNIAIGAAATGIAVVMAEDASKVSSVGLGNVDGVTLAYQEGVPGGASASATKEGNTYKITGNATGVDMANPMQPVTKPFEIEVTCP